MKNAVKNMVWPEKDLFKKSKKFAFWLAGALLFFYSWQFISQNTIWFFVYDAPQQAVNFISRMFPPNWSYINNLWRPIWDTFNIAVLGTILGILISTVLAFLTAENTSPHFFVRKIGLVFIVTSRSINSLIWAIILVVIMGPGVLAGIIAIGIRSVGFLAKLLSEAIEEIDEKQLEAITATGANRWKTILYGVVPQIKPAFAGISVYRWDINIRESTVVGLVGAGGLGIQLNTAVLSLRWDNAIIIFFIILFMVFISEFISAKIRSTII